MTIITNWHPSHSCSPASFTHSQVHVWRYALNPIPPSLAPFRTWLSPEEHNRADRLINASAQRQFVVSRCMLRQLLGWYGGVPSSDIQITIAEQGKPFPVFPTGADIQCNVSHTNGLVVVAISGSAQVGIDVEAMDRTVNALNLANRFFSTREARQLAALTEDDRAWLFLTYWTCKEAYLKMRGIGLQGDLSKHEIELDIDSPGASITGLSAATSPRSYTLWRMNPAEGFVGALAIETHHADVAFFDWTPHMLTPSHPF